MNKQTFVAIILTTILLIGCASTQQAKHVETDSFLAPYSSLLTRDDSGQRALLHYNNPDTDWADYHQLQLKPVLLLTSNESDLSTEDKAQLQELVDDFYVELYNNLSNDYTMVKQPGPGVLQMQVAISHGEPSNVAPALISKLPSPARLANTAWNQLSGKPAFSGGVTLEVVIKDGQNGKLLAAAADRRVGGMKLFQEGAFDSWNDVHNGLQFYAKAITYQLCKARGDMTRCHKP